MTIQCFVYHTPPDDFCPAAQAAGCYCECEGNILFLKRHQDKPQGNTWGIPGGKLEKGESPREAVIREVQEEVGLKIFGEQLQEIGTIFVRLPFVDYIFHLFRFPFECQPPLNIALDEHVEGKWLTFEEASEIPLIAGGLEALNVYRQWMET